MKETIGNGLDSIVAQAIEEMKAEQGAGLQLERLNLAELERRAGISRARLRHLQKTGFVSQPHGRIGKKACPLCLRMLSTRICRSRTCVCV